MRPEDYIAETMRVLGTDADEVWVSKVLPLRNNVGPNEHALLNPFNDLFEH